MSKMVPRHKILAFYGVTVLATTIFYRMEKFTQLSKSQGASEHDRHYVDEESGETDIMGINPSISYAFDKYRNLPVQTDIVNITNDGLLGSDAVRPIIIVDTETNEAYKRDFSVIPNTDGDNTNVYTYNGTFKCNGGLISGFASTDDNYKTITFSTRRKEMTGVPPLSFVADGEPLLDWYVKGAVGGVAKKINYLKQESVTISNGSPAGSTNEGTITYDFSKTGPSIPDGSTYAKNKQQWLTSTYSKKTSSGGNTVGVDVREVSYNNCQYKAQLLPGSYKLVMEAFDHSGQWYSDRITKYASTDGYRGTPVIALLKPNDDVILQEEFDRALYQGNNYIHLEYSFTLTDPVEVGLFFQGMGHNTSTEEFEPRFMIVDSDTVAKPFSVTYSTRLYEGVSCWALYKVTLTITVTGPEESTTIDIELENPLTENEIMTMTESGVTIPTYAGINTISIDSKVLPSEMYIKILE